MVGEIKRNVILQGDCFELIKTLPDNSIDCIITSPPYWQLRDYGYPGQWGLETTYQEYLENLWSLMDEIRRALKDTGTAWINLGDVYGSGAGSNNMKNTAVQEMAGCKSMPGENGRKDNVSRKREHVSGLKKSLLLIPSRFAAGCIDRGWTLRNQIIWHKPNQMPSSATDRFTVDFEEIFFFVKQSTGYYFEQQLEPYTKPLDRWGGEDLTPSGKSDWDNGTGQTTYRKRRMRPNPGGRNARTVWSMITEPLPEAHFAAYPEKLVVRMIKAGCPEGGLVLDPFMGSGTTAVVAKKLNRDYLGFELNSEYIEIAENRIYKKLGMFA